VKLPETHELALTLPYVSPSGYGLGKAGWVTADLPKGRKIPVDLFEDWIDESYRAVAPKALVRTLDGTAAGSRRRHPAPANSQPTSRRRDPMRLEEEWKVHRP
jgi:hypothetical protein